MSIQLFENSITGAVRISGEDSLDYLQSQLTIDLSKLSIHQTRSALRLSLKGKVLFGTQVIHSAEEGFLLFCQDTTATEVISLLEENVVADEVEFWEIRENWILSTFYHPTSQDRALDILGINQLKPREAVPLNGGWAYRNVSMPGESISLIHKNGHLRELGEKISLGNPIEWEILRLRHGFFYPGKEIGSEEFPQEGGLEREWVDFDKGCYLGQEVMARIHAMGKVRKQALAVEGGGHGNITLPCSLLAEDKKVGTLKSRFSIPDSNKFVGAAVIHENAVALLQTKGLQIEGTQQKVNIFQG
jgi:folate-binding protein YgfZ